MCATKDECIKKGEIGLSQALLSSGVELSFVYPLVKSLLTDQAMAEELQVNSISRAEHVNEGLMTCKSLLARGLPFVIKYVLFSLADIKLQKMAITELSRYLPNESFNLLSDDIQRLLFCRYSNDLRGIS